MEKYNWSKYQFPAEMGSTQIYIDLVPDLLIIFEFRPKGSDTNSTVFVLHYWTLSTGPSTDGPSGRTAPGVERQLLKVTDSS